MSVQNIELAEEATIAEECFKEEPAKLQPLSNHLCTAIKDFKTEDEIKNQAKEDNSNEQLQELKNNLSGCLPPEYTDGTLRKFIKAANQDLKKAESLLRLKISTREVFELDKTMRGEYVVPEVFEKYGIVSHLGSAKDGTPLTYVAIGRGDLKGYIHTFSSIDLSIIGAHYIDADIKRIEMQTKKIGKEINGITFILDMEEFAIQENLSTHMMETAVDQLRQLQNMYPEVWENILLINVSYYFYVVYNLLRPILRASLVDTIHIAPKDGTPDLLLKFVDKDVLPTFLGGTRTDSNGDPMCKEFMKFGGPIPESCYAINQPCIQPDDLDVENIWIYAGYSHNHSVIVKEPNSRLHVEIKSEGGSLHTSLFFRELGKDPDHPDIPSANEYLSSRDENSNVRLICPAMNLQTQVTPTNCCHKAPWPGIYIWRFDNSRSWVYGKRAIFRIRVLPPS